LENLKIKTDFLLVDGNSTLPNWPVNQKAVIGGDEKIWSCAAASIIAKVTRDRLMLKYHRQYSAYGFDRHKGYGTTAHIRALKKHGASPIHRLSFRPLKLVGAVDKAGGIKKRSLWYNKIKASP